MQHISIPSTPILNGNVAAMLTFAALFNTAGIAAGVKVATIRADAKNPVLLQFFAEVTTAFVTGTHVLTVGSNAAAADQFLAAADITEGTVGFYPAANANKKFRIVADTDIFIKNTAADATAGAALIYMEVTPLFPSPSGQYA